MQTGSMRIMLAIHGAAVVLILLLIREFSSESIQLLGVGGLLLGMISYVVLIALPSIHPERGRHRRLYVVNLAGLTLLLYGKLARSDVALVMAIVLMVSAIIVFQFPRTKKLG